MMTLPIRVSVFALILPLPLLAAEPDASFRHMFKTTYFNGPTLEGTMDVGRTQNCVRIAQPPDKLDPNQVRSESNPVKDEIIFCRNPEPMMTAINHDKKTYGVMDGKTIAAMTKQREEIMKSLGIDPGSGEEQGLAQALGNAMGMIKQKQREALDTRMQDTDMTPEERAKVEAYRDTHFPPSQSSNAFALSSEITKTGDHGEQEGISCVWYKHVVSGLVQDISRVCAAAWEDVPGGQRTKEVFHGWYDFMDSLMKNSPMKNDAFETFKKIDRFPLIRITEDEQGNARREERYMGTKNLKVSYAPPAEYTLEAHNPFGEKMSPGQTLPPGDSVTSPRREGKQGPGSASATIPTGECRKIPGKGIVCNTGEDDQKNLLVNPDFESRDPNENAEEMGSKVNELLKGMGLGDLLNQGQ